MKVLVIDDDTEILEMLKAFFEVKGHSFQGVTTASGGVAEMAINQPDVIFLDIGLPDEDGLVTLKKIKAISESIPVVMITAYKNADKVIESFKYGATDCLLKPFNFDYLENKILTKIGI